MHDDDIDRLTEWLATRISQGHTDDIATRLDILMADLNPFYYAHPIEDHHVNARKA